MSTTLQNDICVIGDKPQYDANVKRVLSHKRILAQILTGAIAEFRGMNPAEVAQYIEGEPGIGSTPVDPGYTNAQEPVHSPDGELIAGLNTEDSSLQEGTVRYDIIFYVRMRDGLTKMIINIEAQKDSTPGYQILNRAFYYVCRLVSSQKNREFQKSNYDDIKSVASIWICMNMEADTLDHFHMTQDKLLGAHKWEGNLDMLNIVMIGIQEHSSGQEMETVSESKLHHLLGTLLSKTLSARARLDILKDDFGIESDDELKEGVKLMCNLSEAIEERGIERGIKLGEERNTKKVVLNMYKKGYRLDMIAELLELSTSQVKEMLKESGMPDSEKEISNLVP